MGIAPLAVGFWLGGRDTLHALVINEFVVIHGFPFLVIATWSARNARGAARVASGVMLGLVLLLCGAFAWGAGDGWPGSLRWAI